MYAAGDRLAKRLLEDSALFLEARRPASVIRVDADRLVVHAEFGLRVHASIVDAGSWLVNRSPTREVSINIVAGYLGLRLRLPWADDPPSGADGDRRSAHS